MELTLKELVNTNRLNKLIEHEALSEEERKMLKAYRKKVSKQAKSVEVVYTKRHGMGRRYAEKSLSLQNFRKQIRHTLAHDSKIDIDIVNCHPVVLSQYCHKHNINCDLLDHYNEHREMRLSELMECCHCSRGEAKTLVLMLMYLSSVGEACIKTGIACPPPQWLDALERHFKQLAEMIVALNPDIFKKVSTSRSKEYTNKKASCVSYVLQIVEDDIICHAMNWLNGKGFNVETLCFDGVLIGNNKTPTSDDLGHIQGYCLEKTGYNVRFELKPMTDGLDIDDTDKFNFSEYAFEHTAQYKQLYCSQLEVEGSSQGTYELRKAYIERFLSKIQVPDACFIFQNGDLRKGEMYPEPHIYAQQTIKCLFQPIMSGKCDGFGNPISFYDEWMKDASHRLYRKYDFIPYSVNHPPPTDVFNMFMGFNPSIYGEPVDAKVLDVWFDLCLALCGDNKEDADYFQSFIANIFQDPVSRPPICLIFKGNQGTGKNMVLDAIGNMIGQDHYISSSNPKDFFGDHAEGFYRKLLVNLNEAEGRDTFEFEGRIKSFITEPSITVNPKFVRPTTVQNHARCIITTNKPTPIPIDVKSTDRRYVVYQTSDRFKKYNSHTWTKMYWHFRKPEFMATLYRYYMSKDLSQIDWRNDRPITAAYREMCNMFSPTEALFMEDYIDNKRWCKVPHTESVEVEEKEEEESEDELSSQPDGEQEEEEVEVNLAAAITVKAQDLFNEYDKFCKDHRFKKENNSPNSRSFIGRLVQLELPMTRSKTGGSVYWRFTPNSVMEYMTKRKWIGDYGLDSVDKEVGENMDPGMFEY